MKRALVVALVLLAASACSDSDEGSSAARPPSPVSSPEPSRSGPTPFDRLTIRLELSREEVGPGGGIPSLISVRNTSDRSVTDPGCLLYAPRYALIPADDPTADLWGSVVVDCAGSNTMRPGFRETSVGPTFSATDMYGDPLPPGEYVAAMELELLSRRLLVPVTIVED